MYTPRLPYAFIVPVLISAVVVALPGAAVVKPSLDVVMLLAAIYYSRSAS